VTTLPSAHRAPWSPWWAVALTGAALVMGALIFTVGWSVLVDSFTDTKFAGLGRLMGAIVLASAVSILLPGVLFLVLRRRFLFIITALTTATVLFFRVLLGV
jgi:hypothetical protein